jgi:hypothetical protein
MLDFIINNNREALMSLLLVKGVVIFTVWLLMIFACFVDFWSGISTAKALKQKLNSHGFRKTLEKIADYFKVMLVGLMIDLLGSIFVWYEFPYASILMCLSVLIIEGKSVMENVKRKKARAGEIDDVIKQIISATTSDDAQLIFKKIGSLVDAVNKNEKWESEEKEAHSVASD